MSSRHLTEHDGEAPRSRGRPRDPAKDAAIREAACVVLAERGYDGLTFEAVADQAQCSRAALYRRFPGKLDLVEATLYENARAMAPSLPADAAPRDRLAAHVEAFTRFIAGERGRAILTLMEASTRIPELRAMVQRQAAAEEGYFYREFRRLAPAGVDRDLMAFVFDTLVGAVIYHVAFRGRALAQADILRLVDQAVSTLCAAQQPVARAPLGSR